MVGILCGQQELVEGFVLENWRWMVWGLYVYEMRD